MQRNGLMPLSILVLALIAIDFYAFKGVRLLLKGVASGWVVSSVRWGYWVWSIGVLVMMVVVFTNFNDVLQHVRISKSYFIPFTTIAIILLNLLPKLWFIAFHLIEDVSWLGIVGVRKVIGSGSSAGQVMDRFTFLSRLGLVVAGIQFSWILYGLSKGRFNFSIIHETLEFDNLPDAFDGLRVVQISDLHIGSFYNNYSQIEAAVEMVNSLKPDVIFFTGDLINNYTWELDGWDDILKKLEAKDGIYSILGNHDYGDYGNFSTPEEKANNLTDLKSRQGQIGFQMLNNTSVRLEKGDSFIDLIGVENWGKRSLVNYGNLSEAMKNTSENSFKILLSHDPTHWQEEVRAKTNIDITLSGHTHGMQMGVEVAGIKWSPAKYLYKHWAGLYREGNQVLYVNRGLGYTLFPGRLGIRPEITLINFRKHDRYERQGKF
jgi:uncharacterized protein